MVTKSAYPSQMWQNSTERRQGPGSPTRHCTAASLAMLRFVRYDLLPVQDHIPRGSHLMKMPWVLGFLTIVAAFFGGYPLFRDFTAGNKDPSKALVDISISLLTDSVGSGWLLESTLPERGVLETTIRAPSSLVLGVRATLGDLSLAAKPERKDSSSFRVRIGHFGPTGAVDSAFDWPNARPIALIVPGARPDQVHFVQWCFKSAERGRDCDRDRRNQRALSVVFFICAGLLAAATFYTANKPKPGGPAAATPEVTRNRVLTILIGATMEDPSFRLSDDARKACGDWLQAVLVRRESVETANRRLRETTKTAVYAEVIGAIGPIAEDVRQRIYQLGVELVATVSEA
jgi:hypothetical protein